MILLPKYAESIQLSSTLYNFEKWKNEKCLFSNTQEFLHNIFIKSFK